jgi:16S rRNA (cytosine967-C5)-methyltransferase
LRLLDSVLRQGLALDAVLVRATHGIPRASDRALAHAIAAEVLRRLPDLDALIDSATAQPLPHDAKARTVLRIALVQALVLGTPQHAAISTALPLVDGGPRKLVHGVFGTLMRNEVTLPAPPTLPPDLAERWRAHWGDAMTADAARAIAAPPPVDFTLKDTRWAEELRGKSLLPGHIRLSHPGSVVELPGYEEGGWWVQDIAASLPARLIGTGAGTAIDACAAPGGKTMQLAAAGWRVTAIDVSESRLARLSENLARTKLEAEVVEADALFWSPDEPADSVLLDAPCSATGIFRRHPDVLYRATPAIIAEMAEVQTALLGRAASWVRPGGTLVYATCSLEPEEGEAQVEAFLARERGFAIDPIRSEELPAGVTPHQRGWLRLLPGTLADEGGCDGFFIARMRHIG